MQNQLGLPAGTFLSDFALPDLSGQIVRVSDLVGYPYLLLFVSPSCDSSAEVLQYLGELPAAELEHLRVLTICSGGEEAARDTAERHHLKSQVLIQEENELAQFMRVTATPAAYIVNESRTTTGDLAIGVEAVMSLLPAIFTPIDLPLSLDSKVSRATRLSPGMATKRHGLPVGEGAPELSQRSISGRDVSLSSNRGRWTLLVFWSADCPRCDDVVETLATVASMAPGLTLMIISRGDERQHAELAARLGADAPIMLQEERWISRRFQTFDAPAAYLIDPDGRIAKPVASGREAVQKLAQVAIAWAETTPA